MIFGAHLPTVRNNIAVTLPHPARTLMGSHFIMPTLVIAAFLVIRAKRVPLLYPHWTKELLEGQETLFARNSVLRHN
jgi:hypothetical protein